MLRPRSGGPREKLKAQGRPEPDSEARLGLRDATASVWRLWPDRDWPPTGPPQGPLRRCAYQCHHRGPRGGAGAPPLATPVSFLAGRFFPAKRTTRLPRGRPRLAGAPATKRRPRPRRPAKAKVRPLAGGRRSQTAAEQSRRGRGWAPRPPRLAGARQLSHRPPSTAMAIESSTARPPCLPASACTVVAMSAAASSSSWRPERRSPVA